VLPGLMCVADRGRLPRSNMLLSSGAPVGSQVVMVVGDSNEQQQQHRVGRLEAVEYLSCIKQAYPVAVGAFAAAAVRCVRFSRVFAMTSLPAAAA
jgi:hypothetical protein